MILRRWQLVDQWTSYDGSVSRNPIGRYWTRWGARLSHKLVSPFLSPRGGQATILLHDRLTGADIPLSTQ